MTRFLWCLFGFFLAAGVARSQSITIPATVQVDAPGLIVIRATASDLEDARWYPLSPGIQTFPPDVIPPNPKVFLGLALTPGVYKIGVVPAKDVNGKAKIGDAQICTVTVGTPPPGPGPGPGPSPALDLSAAWAQETDPAKLGQAVLLAQLYTYMASSAGLGNVTTVTDWSQASKLLQSQGKSLGINRKLPVVQAAVAKAFVAAVPAATSGSGPISAADRSAATTFFGVAAQAVGSLK